MTLEQFTQRMGRKFSLRYFRDDKNVPDPTKQWRAAFAGHYYTSDTARLIGSPQWDDGRDGEGWGATPDEAVTALADIILADAERRIVDAHERVAEHEKAAAALRAQLYPDAPVGAVGFTKPEPRS